MEDILWAQLLPSHVIMDTLGLDVYKLLVCLLDLGIYTLQHATEVMKKTFVHM